VSKIKRESRSGVRGRRSLDRAFSGEINRLQRERVLVATIEVVEAEGYASLTVAKITERSAISRRTFYALFHDREDCFLAAFEQILAEAHEPVARAYSSQLDWRSGMRAAVLEMLALIDERPGAAKLCIVDALMAGQTVFERRAQVLDELSHKIDRACARNGRGEGRAMASAAVAGIAAVLHTYFVAEAYSPANLSGTLLAMIVLPYRGRAAAKTELTASEPARRRTVASVSRESNPLQTLSLRVTYRTIRVLIAIAEQPDASNRQVARASGVVDQGQISKLLRRLRDLGLIENRGDGAAKGRANAWRLTALGAEVQRATGGR
jgi:AcrR family transcriptional regulator/DNA-binding MarR family transcriptional regulator